MGKFVYTIICVILVSALSSAQDIRRLMLMRQRELALRRAGFPFGVGGPIRGPGIPPPIAARLALLERQRAFVPFIGSPFDTTALGGPRFGSGGPFGFGGPFGSPFTFSGPLSGPPDLSGLDLSGLDLSSSGPGETITFSGSDGLSTPGFSPFGIGLPSGPFGGGLPVGPIAGGLPSGPFGGSMPSGPIGLPDGMPGGQEGSVGPGGPSGVPTPDGSSSGSISVETGGSGNVFGQPPSQAEFLENTRGTVEPSPQMENSGNMQMMNPRNGFSPIEDRRNGPIPNSPMDRFRTRQENTRDRPPVQLQPPLPEIRPPMPLIGPNPMMRGPVPMPLPLQQPFIPLAPPMFPMPPGPVMPPRPPSRRRPAHRRRNQRTTTPRVFPRVPDIPQIPLAPGGQGQQNDGQQTGSGGFGQEGGSQTDSQSLVFNAQTGMTSPNGDPRMGVQTFFPGQITGMAPGFPSTGPGFQPSGPGFPGGPGFPPTGPGFAGSMRQGGAIFPSQSTQQPTMRQPGPGFSEAFSGSTTSFSASPNGQPLQQLQGGGPQTFGQNNRFLQPGEVSPGGFPAGTVFPGLSGSPFGSTMVGPAPGQRFPGFPMGGRGPGGPFPPRFGFVGPNNAAGPEFTTNSQSSQDFNIQFQPLPGTPQGQEFRPGQGQMGNRPNFPPMSGNGGFGQSNNMQFRQQNFGGGFEQSNGQFGASQSNTQFGSGISTTNKFDGGFGQSGMTTGGDDQSSFSSGGSSSSTITNVNVITNRPNDAPMSFGSGSIDQNAASLTVTDRVVEENMLNNNNNNEFRLVQVGDIVDNSGLIKTSVTDVNTDGTNTNTITEIRTTNFQPAGDIETAFGSFGTVAGDNIIDLSMADSANDINTAAATDTSASKTVSTSSSTSSSSSSSSSNSLTGSPFANSINNDFSFFMDNSPPPNEMPPITLTNDAIASVESKHSHNSTDVEGDIHVHHNDGFTSINDVSDKRAVLLSDPIEFDTIFTEFFTNPHNDITPVISGPPGSQTMTFPVTGNTGSEVTSSGGQGGSFTMTSSTSFSSSSSSGTSDNSMGDIAMGGNSMGDIVMPDNTMGEITIPGMKSPAASSIGSTVAPTTI